jgi:DNA-binding MarR family transcriptional regulator
MREEASYELVALIKRQAALLHQNIDARLKPYGLARTQYVVEPATLSGIIDTLEAKGLVTRIEHTEDKRRKDVQLTDAGRIMVDTIPPPGPVMERILRQEVNPGDVHILKAVGQQMVRNLEQELQKQEGRH